MAWGCEIRSRALAPNPQTRPAILLMIRSLRLCSGGFFFAGTISRITGRPLIGSRPISVKSNRCKKSRSTTKSDLRPGLVWRLVWGSRGSPRSGVLRRTVHLGLDLALVQFALGIPNLGDPGTCELVALLSNSSSFASSIWECSVKRSSTVSTAGNVGGAASVANAVAIALVGEPPRKLGRCSS